MGDYQISHLIYSVGFQQCLTELFLLPGCDVDCSYSPWFFYLEEILFLPRVGQKVIQLLGTISFTDQLVPPVAISDKVYSSLGRVRLDAGREVGGEVLSVFNFSRPW
ncbi:hypothetical protein KAU04_06835 [bacterium]|nr:hypothetical protein [bacterium]